MKRKTQGQRAERRRVEQQLHEELDVLTDLAKKLIAAAPQNDLDLFALELLRGAVLERTQDVNKKLNTAGVKEPRRDGIRNQIDN